MVAAISFACDGSTSRVLRAFGIQCEFFRMHKSTCSRRFSTYTYIYIYIYIYTCVLYIYIYL